MIRKTSAARIGAVLTCCIMVLTGCGAAQSAENRTTERSVTARASGLMLMVSKELVVAAFTDLFAWRPAQHSTPEDGVKAAVDATRVFLTPDFDAKSDGVFDYLSTDTTATADSRNDATEQLTSRWAEWRAAGASIEATVIDSGTTDDFATKTDAELRQAGLLWGKARARVRQFIRYPDGRIAPYRVFIAEADLVLIGSNGVELNGPSGWKVVRYPTISDELALTPLAGGGLSPN